MADWAYNGKVYQVISMYLVPEDAWTYEVSGPMGTSSPVAGLAVVIPDATPDDGQFTPMDASHARVATAEGRLPWPVLQRFVRLVETSGDVPADAHGATVIGDLSLSLNTWRFADRVFEVNSFHLGDDDCWCYELHEVDPTSTSNDHIDVRIPDRRPDGGPFAPDAAEHVVFASHGSFALPWLVFRHFLDMIAASGDIVDDPPPAQR